MSTDRFVHLPPLTPIEARVLYGVLAAWLEGHDMTNPTWDAVNSLQVVTFEAMQTNDAAARDAVSKVVKKALR
jgi:hypothetical protein